MSDPEQTRAVSVAGGYWTGSSAAVDLLREHRDCTVLPGEFTLFSFGQLFEEVTRPLLQGQIPHEEVERNLFRYREFNRSDPLPLVRAAARRVCLVLGAFPPSVFSHRAGMADRLGDAYVSACERASATLERACEDGEPPDPEVLSASFGAILREAVRGAQDGEGHGFRLGVFDQMVAPPYVEPASDVLPGLRYVAVDRDWRDQYISLRQVFDRMTRVNRHLGLRPWAEDYEALDGSLWTFFVRLRRKIRTLRESQSGEGRGDVLWLDFEEIAHRPDRTARSLFAFLDLDPERREPGTVFDPEFSKTRIRKWERSEWRTGPLTDEIAELERVLGTPD